MQPVPVVTWWGNEGFPFLAILFAVLAIALVAYVATLRDVPRLPLVLAASAGALLAGLFWLPIFSSDVYAYAAYGEILRLGGNPYAPIFASNDAIVSAARWQWQGTLPICVYGPLFVVIASAIVSIAQHLGTAAQIGLFRPLSCTAFLLSAALLARAGGRNDESRGVVAAAVFALNPVALWAAIEGHNDTLMLCVALAGAALYRRNATAGAFVAGLAGLVKAPALVAGAGFVLNDLRDRRALAAAVAGIVAVILASLPLAYGLTHTLAPHGRYAPFASVQSLHPLVALALAAVLVSLFSRTKTLVDRLLLVALIAWLAIPNPYPWYALWLLPLAGWATDRDLRTTAIAVGAVATLRYIPDAIAIPGTWGTIVLGAAALLAYSPLLRRAIIMRS